MRLRGFFNLLIITVSIMFLCSCSSAKIDEYKGRQPTLDLREFFKGDVDADGAFFNRSGLVEKQFHVVMKGTWHGNDGKLEEWFTYSDGTKSQRVWTIKFNDDNTFTGTAPDVIGEAKGQQAGNASHMKYVLRVPMKGGKTVDVSMDDWLYKLDDKVMINKVAMSKFGFKVGELVITFKKH